MSKRWSMRLLLLLTPLAGLMLIAATPTVPEAALDMELPDSFTQVARVVAVGDVHGDLDAFEEVLRLTGLIDTKGHWSGGKAHLVQTGDVPDRGDQTRAIFNLLMRLEQEARAAGGRVHALL